VQAPLPLLYCNSIYLASAGCPDEMSLGLFRNLYSTPVAW
jgi:hypothetical protein